MQHRDLERFTGDLKLVGLRFGLLENRRERMEGRDDDLGGMGGGWG